MDEFVYDERIVIDHLGDPFLRWAQESWFGPTVRRFTSSEGSFGLEGHAAPWS
jgi:hypothetical protein